MFAIRCTPLAVTLILIATCVAQAESPSAEQTILAGRTPAQHADDLSSENRVVRLRAIRSLAAIGAPVVDHLVGALDHDDAAVRYIAAVALGDNQLGDNQRGDHQRGSSGDGALIDDVCKKRLLELTDDRSSLSVQMAASYALCRAGMLDEPLQILVDRLQYPERGMVCSAAELIGKIGPPAKEAVAPLEALYQSNKVGVKGGDYHVGGAAKNALRKVQDAE